MEDEKKMDKKEKKSELPGPSVRKDKTTVPVDKNRPDRKHKYCEIGDGQSCYWQEEYFKLKREQDEYKKCMDKEFSTWAVMEAKLLLLKRKCGDYKSKLESETEELERMAVMLAELNLDTFQRGVQEGLKRGETQISKTIEYYQSERFGNEVELLGAQGQVAASESKLELMKLKYERKVAELERESVALSMENEALKNDVEKIRLDAAETIHAYRSAKRKSVDDYAQLHELYTKEKIDRVTNQQSHVRLLTEFDEMTKLYNQVLHQKLELEGMNKALKEMHLKDLATIKTFYETREEEIQKQIRLHINDFMGILSGVKQQHERVCEVINQGHNRDVQLANTFKQFKTYMKHVVDQFGHIVQVFGLNQNDSIAVPSPEAKEDAEWVKVTQSLMALKLNLCRYMQSVSNVLREVSESIGLEYNDTISSNLDKYILIETNIAGQMIKAGREETLKLFSDWKIEEMALGKLVEGVKEWQKTLVLQKEQYMERQRSLQMQLRNEQRLRIQIEEKSGRKLRIYKTLVLKLKDSVEKQTKFNEDHFVPPSKYFQRPNNWAHGQLSELNSLPVPVDYPLCCKEKLHKYKVVLEQAELAVDKVDQPEPTMATSRPVAIARVLT